MDKSPKNLKISARVPTDYIYPLAQKKTKGATGSNLHTQPAIPLSHTFFLIKGHRMGPQGTPGSLQEKEPAMANRAWDLVVPKRRYQTKNGGSRAGWFGTDQK